MLAVILSYSLFLTFLVIPLSVGVYSSFGLINLTVHMFSTCVCFQTVPVPGGLVLREIPHSAFLPLTYSVSVSAFPAVRPALTARAHLSVHLLPLRLPLS